MIRFMENMEGSRQGEIQSDKKQEKSIIHKHSSQPKFTSLKEEIMKIPKVKQILQKDRFVYSQDIQKRMELLGNVKNDNFKEQQVIELHELNKKVQKKTRRHKTNFKIPLTRPNLRSLNNLMKDHISKNQFFKNEEKVFLKDYEKTAPFDLERMKFMDDLNPIKKKYKERYPEFKEGVLAKNKLVLEHVILNRNLKREMKLDQKQVSKNNGKKVLESLK